MTASASFFWASSYEARRSCRLAFRLCTVSSAACRFASLTLTRVSAVSRSALVNNPRPLNCWARSKAARASSRLAICWRTEAICSSGGGCLSCPRSIPSCASTCRNALSARSSANCSSLGSRRTRTSPAFTSVPSCTRTSRTTPATSLLIFAWSGEISVPESSTSRCTDMRWTCVVWVATVWPRPPRPPRPVPPPAA